MSDIDLYSPALSTMEVLPVYDPPRVIMRRVRHGSIVGPSVVEMSPKKARELSMALLHAAEDAEIASGQIRG